MTIASVDISRTSWRIRRYPDSPSTFSSILMSLVALNAYLHCYDSFQSAAQFCLLNFLLHTIMFADSSLISCGQNNYKMWVRRSYSEDDLFYSVGMLPTKALTSYTSNTLLWRQNSQSKTLKTTSFSSLNCYFIFRRSRSLKSYEQQTIRLKSHQDLHNCILRLIRHAFVVKTEQDNVFWVVCRVSLHVITYH